MYTKTRYRGGQKKTENQKRKEWTRIVAITEQKLTGKILRYFRNQMIKKMSTCKKYIKIILYNSRTFRPYSFDNIDRNDQSNKVPKIFKTNDKHDFEYKSSLKRLKQFRIK